MRLRTKFLLFVIILHAVALVLSFIIFRQNKLFFIASEILILLSVYIAWQLYHQLLQPLNMLVRGAEAIKDKDFSVKFVQTGKYEMDELIHVYNHMIDELREERTKQEEQHFFLEKLIQTSPTGIVILDFEDRVNQINPKALDLLNLNESDTLNRAVGQLSHPVMQQIADLRSGESKTVTFGSGTYKIQKSHFVDRGFPRHFIMIEELTAEILAAEKKAYGKVIRMMAHEVNNTIGPVNSILESALKSGTLLAENKSNSIRQALQVAVNRNRNLNLFMRNFADVVRIPEPVRKTIDLHQLIRGVADLMELKAKEKDIDFRYEFAGASFDIFADYQQMEQVLLNIIKNSIEAIEYKGMISFETDIKKRQLVITDTGKGITEAVEENLFTPFYSTKKDGQGIGLTLIKEILLNHGFEYYLKTTSPHKTQFTIKF